MQVEEALRNLLLSDAALVALVGTRIYPTQAPASTTFPYGVYQEADRKSVMTYSGPKQLNSYSLDLSWWATTYASAKACGAAAKRVLNGYKGDAGVAILGIFDETESDDSEQPQHGDERGLFAVSMTLNVWFREAAA